MAIINNSQLTRELIDGAKINIVADDVPSRLASAVVPVMETNPKLLNTTIVVKSTAFSNNASTVIYTTDANKRFFITGCWLSFVKDVNATTTNISLNVIPKGNTTQFTQLIYFNTTTLTAERDGFGLTFPSPIELEKGSAISVISGTAVGNFYGRGIVMGYYIED